MAMPASPNPKSIVDLLLGSSGTVQEIAKYLRSNERTKDMRHFYSSVIAHCLVIQGQLQRAKGSIPDDHQLIQSMLRRLGAIVKTSVAEEQVSLPDPGISRLLVLKKWWEAQQEDGTPIKPESVMQFIDVGRGYDESHALIEFFEKWEDDIQEAFPESSSLWSRHALAHRQESRKQPVHAVPNALQSLFRAVLECKDCGCQPEHELGVRLCLGTFRCLSDVSKPLKRDYGCRIFISLENEWHEASVCFTKDKAINFVSPHLPANRDPSSHAMKVKSLCETLKKKHLSDRLRLLVDESGQLYKLRSDRCSFAIDRAEEPVSLQHLLENENRSLTDKTKRILAVILANSVVYLLGTSWLPSTWGPSNVLFFKTTSASIPLKPFIDTRVRNHVNMSPEDRQFNNQCVGVTDLDDIDPDDMLVHQCPHVLNLGIMLMEIYFAMPFEELARTYGIQLNDHTRLMQAELVFRQCKNDIPEYSQFHYAIGKCLNPKGWEDENAAPLNDQTLRETIYQEVVVPLEDELSKAFNHISLDNLDNIAQTLDLSSWGPPMHDTHIRTFPAIQIAMERTAAPAHFTSIFKAHGCQPSKQDVDLFRGRLASCSAQVSAINQSMSQRACGLSNGVSDSTYYGGMRFFDKETAHEEHSNQARVDYDNWRARFKGVYDTYITQPPKNSVKIAILDSGLDLKHPLIATGIEQVKGVYNWTSEKSKLIDDDQGHGTFIAGLLLEYSPDAEIYIAKTSVKSGPCNPRIIARAIDYAVNQWKVDMISMSFGFQTRDIDGYDELENAIHRAYASHVLLFGCASNDGANHDRVYPARDEHVICIHSTDANGNRSPFSPTPLEDTINLATVGEAVESSIPLRFSKDPLGMQHLSGTSYSTPIAVAIAAFVMQYVRLYVPERAHMLRKQSRMKAVLRRIAEKSQPSRPRDGYHYMVLNGFSDNLFGKDQKLINATLRDLLSQ